MQAYIVQVHLREPAREHAIVTTLSYLWKTEVAGMAVAARTTTREGMMAWSCETARQYSW
jgi:hypothetical protein